MRRIARWIAEALGSGYARGHDSTMMLIATARSCSADVKVALMQRKRRRLVRRLKKSRWKNTLLRQEMTKQENRRLDEITDLEREVRRLQGLLDVSKEEAKHLAGVIVRDQQRVKAETAEMNRRVAEAETRRPGI